MKFTLHPLNIHTAFPSLYNTLRQMSVTQNILAQTYLQTIETSVNTQLNAKGQTPTDQSLSDTLRLHLNYLKWEIFQKPYICYYHKLCFENMSAYKQHIESSDHIKENSTIYLKFKELTLLSKTANLNIDDLQYLNTLGSIEQKREGLQNVVHLKITLPMISLLNIEHPPRTHTISIHTALKTLCQKATTLSEDEVHNLVSHFKSLKVNLSLLKYFKLYSGEIILDY